MTQRSFTLVTKTSVTSEASPRQVFAVISDLDAHLEWSGARASDDTFKLLSIEQTSEGDVRVGTTFGSTGANFNGTFHDRSEIGELVAPKVFVIETDAHLDRKRGRPWDVHFSHRYDVEPSGTGSRITYTETITRLNYIPWWLRWWARPLFKPMVNRADRKQLRNLAALAQERSATQA